MTATRLAVTGWLRGKIEAQILAGLKGLGLEAEIESAVAFGLTWNQLLVELPYDYALTVTQSMPRRALATVAHQGKDGHAELVLLRRGSSPLDALEQLAEAWHERDRDDGTLVR